VLVLLYPHQDAWHLPLTLRPAHLADHAGQISLPGGAIEEGETSREAAVREFHEELGAEGLGMEFCGRLSRRYVSVSNFRITPWVAVTDRRPDWRPDPAEVAQLMEIPLAHLLDPASLGSHRREQRGESYVTPHFTWQSYRIWGATFAILSELAAVLAFEAV
jgi:8-oxo-dGTP pyrophosphatase MutT (NUDIX family)